MKRIAVTVPLLGLRFDSPASHRWSAKRNLITAAFSIWIFLLVLNVGAVPWMGQLMIRDSQVWSGGRSGNYGTVKYYLDESKSESVPVEVSVQVYSDGNPRSALEVEIFSNVNRRDFAKVWENPNDAGRSDSYFMNYQMEYVSDSGNNFVYHANLTLRKTGAYRLTARFRINHGPWQWHNDFKYDGVNQRDCAVVVSPKKALEISIYEVNPLVVEARPGGGFDQRSTFENFTDHDKNSFNPFNLEYVKNTLGFNTLWIMPAFPITKVRWDPNLKQEIANYSPGSPYATRNYWAVNEWLSVSNNQMAAMNEFRYLVTKADEIGLNVFLDVAFNHAGQDVVYGQGAVDLNLTSPSEINNAIRTSRPAWCTKRPDYRQHASNPDEEVFYAPADRRGEHTWYDAGLEWFFGDYSSLGPKPGYGDTWQGGAMDERDLFYTDLNPEGGHDYEVENVWNYFAHIVPYWLDVTGNRLSGIRADFAQGLPPQAWEYIINKARQKKWDFIFLAEALDPDQIRYRVNRQFDLLTTVDHWLYRSSGVTMSQLVGSLENEANLYGYNAAIMHNGTSHDEEGNGNVWLMLARYSVAASSQGAPMVYMGQPLAVPHKVDFQTSWQNLKSYWDGAIPHVATMYRRINNARQANPALRSSNRYFLTRQNGGGFNENIFSAARWSGENMVLVFVNLRDNTIGPEVYSVPDAIPLQGNPDQKYQAFNLVGDDPTRALWPQPRTVADIRQNGIYVQLNLPNETQYLLLKPE